MGDYQREQNGAHQNAQNNHERMEGCDVEMEEFVSYHFHTDEAEQQSQAIAQQPEKVSDVAKQEEEGAQSHDGENVGEEDDVGVGGDGEYGGDAVDSEDDVGKFDDQQHKEEGSHKGPSVELDKEAVVVYLARDGEETAGKFDHWVVGGVYMLFILFDEHLDTAIDEDDTKNGKHP